MVFISDVIVFFLEQSVNENWALGRDPCLDGRDEDIWRKSKLRSTPTTVQMYQAIKTDDYGRK
jgi:hypothetical protein